MTLADVLLVVLGVVVVAYVLTGGADFGAGVWDLLAFGPRARAQREVIEHALAPIWEVNHICIYFAVSCSSAGFLSPSQSSRLRCTCRSCSPSWASCFAVPRSRFAPMAWNPTRDA